MLPATRASLKEHFSWNGTGTQVIASVSAIGQASLASKCRRQARE